MIRKPKYIDWRTQNANSLETFIADAMRHYQHRYELGVGVLLAPHTETTLKQVEKQWKKLTRSHQQTRQTKHAAEDILTTTRTISRMQRVVFSTETPASNPDASFYVLPEDTTTFPARCSTVYTLHSLQPEQIEALPAETLVVAYGKKQPTTLIPKSQLDVYRKETQAHLLHWMKKHHIRISDLQNDMEHANATLDTILSSARVQNEFLHLTTAYLDATNRSQPYNEQPADTSIHRSIIHLEKQVKALTTGFLSDHIISSTSDDSLLLKDSSGKPIYSLESFAAFIQLQYEKGRVHLAKALELSCGVAR